jgi:hypothetical protein
MTNLVRVSSLRLGIVSSLALVALLVSRAALADGALPCRDGGPGCIHIGFTDAWFDGNVVQLEYSHPFFCAQSPHGPENGQDEGDSACKAGAPATVPPPSGPVVSNVYLLIPLGFAPPPDTLHCPVRGHCIDNPRTIDVSHTVPGGPQGAVLPPHSFVIEDEEAFQSTWWPVVLVFVKNLDAWNTIAAAKSIDAVDACQDNGGCFPEVDTNAFLFFQVLGPGMSPQGPP